MYSFAHIICYFYNYYYYFQFLFLVLLSSMYGASLVAQMVRASAYNAGYPVQSMAQEDSLEKEMATHSSTLA